MSKDNFDDIVGLSDSRGQSGGASHSNPVRLSPDAFARQLQDLNASWRNDFAEMQKRDLDFAFRLARCTTGPEAMKVCVEWMGTRSGSVFDMQKQFFDLWTRYANVSLSEQKESRDVAK